MIKLDFLKRTALATQGIRALCFIHNGAKNLFKILILIFYLMQLTNRTTFLSNFTVKMALLSLEQSLRGVFGHGSAPYNGCRLGCAMKDLWGLCANS